MIIVLKHIWSGWDRISSYTNLDFTKKFTTYERECNRRRETETKTEEEDLSCVEKEN